MTERLRTTFTLHFPGWKPWVARSTDTDMALELLERASEAIADRGVSDYIAVLSNDFPACKTRDAVHHHTFAGDDDAQVDWRQPGTLSTSLINGCVFCAAVHALICAQKSDNREAIDRFLADGLATELPPIEQAIVELGAAITNDPDSLTSANLQPLRDLGFDDDQILVIAI